MCCCECEYVIAVILDKLVAIRQPYLIRQSVRRQHPTAVVYLSVIPETSLVRSPACQCQFPGLHSDPVARDRQTVSFHCFVVSTALRSPSDLFIYAYAPACCALNSAADKQLAPIKCSPRLPRACVLGSRVSRRSVTSRNTRHACHRQWPRVRPSSAVKSITRAYP